MLTIRSTRLEDAPAVAECVDKIANERRFLASTTGFSVAETHDYIATLLIYGVHLILCNSVDVVGWCDITPGIFDGLTHVGHLSMGLLPAFRSQGRGKALLTEALNVGLKKKFEQIELEVFASNAPALALYRNKGFVEQGRKRKARKLDGEYDDIIMFSLLREEWETTSVSEQPTLCKR